MWSLIIGLGFILKLVIASSHAEDTLFTEVLPTTEHGEQEGEDSISFENLSDQPSSDDALILHSQSNMQSATDNCDESVEEVKITIIQNENDSTFQNYINSEISELKNEDIESSQREDINSTQLPVQLETKRASADLLTENFNAETCCICCEELLESIEAELSQPERIRHKISKVSKHSVGVQTLGPVISLKCFHVYHHACIKRWIDEKRSCPLCKEEYKKLPVCGNTVTAPFRKIVLISKVPMKLYLRKLMRNKKARAAMVVACSILSWATGFTIMGVTQPEKYSDLAFVASIVFWTIGLILNTFGSVMICHI